MADAVVTVLNSLGGGPRTKKFQTRNRNAKLAFMVEEGHVKGVQHYLDNGATLTKANPTALATLQHEDRQQISGMMLNTPQFDPSLHPNWQDPVFRREQLLASVRTPDAERLRHCLADGTQSADAIREACILAAVNRQDALIDVLRTDRNFDLSMLQEHPGRQREACIANLSDAMQSGNQHQVTLLLGSADEMAAAGAPTMREVRSDVVRSALHMNGTLALRTLLAGGIDPNIELGDERPVAEVLYNQVMTKLQAFAWGKDLQELGRKLSIVVSDERFDLSTFHDRSISKADLNNAVIRALQAGANLHP